ncbi:[formate-C-acetyltransferase]-activating enzyme [Clostridium psychrophilum]|uniref:[formate-C-acetyltransferase]-activating enzyme n=1 Tax=Clostridium psychrophilum TaxID=132926 RepID=UPI001C0B4A8B|nr:[formate-C-acetyltransferase]-activating enzyme [Clostridium psychrophilum]MBU3179736.1 [formate-C-acetyltransferase]-activating enzyme [Clostridium psychrophilum]
MLALILNIQRYSLHDGSGIRTIVFFKGCPLKCPWCCNPEAISFDPQKVKIASKCIHCDHCAFDVDECPTGAITEFGKYMSVEEVVRVVQKDMVFYRTSSGGVTLSGGEVLSQSLFAKELLMKLKSLGINTAIETSGQGDTQNLVEMSDYLDLILFDLKIMDKTKSKLILGADIDLIKNNIKTLVSLHKRVIPRVPLIPGYTMDASNIKDIIIFVKSLNLTEIHLLPFHQYGSNKYKVLNKDYKLIDIEISTPEVIEKIASEMKKNGLKVILNG